MEEKYFNKDSVTETIEINTTIENVWKEINNIEELPIWMEKVKEVTCTLKDKQGLWNARSIIFHDESEITEWIYARKKNKYLAYVKDKGLPSWKWYTTINLNQIPGKVTKVILSSEFINTELPEKDFLKEIADAKTAYEMYLKDLKKRLEKPC